MVEKMKPTVVWLEENYDKANAELFNNELPPCTLGVVPMGSKSFGWFYFQKGSLVDKDTRKMYIEENGRKVYINKDNILDLVPTIELNANMAAPEQDLYATLVHEMCHYYTYMNGDSPFHAHGTAFKRISNLVYERSGGTINVAEMRASKEETARVVFDKDVLQKDKEKLEKKLSNYYISFREDGIRRLFLPTSTMVDTIIQGENEGDGFIIKITDKDIARKFYDLGYRNVSNQYSCWELEDKESLSIADEVLSKKKYKVMKESIYREKKSYIGYLMPFQNLSDDASISDISKKELDENKNKNMKQKRIVRLTESEFNRLIKNIINESTENKQNYQIVGDYHEGFARVRRGTEKWNFIDKDGKLLSNKWYRWIGRFHEGFAEVKGEDGKWYLLNTQGQLYNINTKKPIQEPTNESRARRSKPMRLTESKDEKMVSIKTLRQEGEFTINTKADSIDVYAYIGSNDSIVIDTDDRIDDFSISFWGNVLITFLNKPSFITHVDGFEDYADDNDFDEEEAVEELIDNTREMFAKDIRKVFH